MSTILREQSFILEPQNKVIISPSFRTERTHQENGLSSMIIKLGNLTQQIFLMKHSVEMMTHS